MYGCLGRRRVPCPLAAARLPAVRGCHRDGARLKHALGRRLAAARLPAVRGRHVISVTLGGMPIEGSDFQCHVA